MVQSVMNKKTPLHASHRAMWASRIRDESSNPLLPRLYTIAQLRIAVAFLSKAAST
jgi:hypothetical protein